jgi:hypothetical protein
LGRANWAAGSPEACGSRSAARATRLDHVGSGRLSGISGLELTGGPVREQRSRGTAQHHPASACIDHPEHQGYGSSPQDRTVPVVTPPPLPMHCLLRRCSLRAKQDCRAAGHAATEHGGGRLCASRLYPMSLWARTRSADYGSTAAHHDRNSPTDWRHPMKNGGRWSCVLFSLVSLQRKTGASLRC